MRTSSLPESIHVGELRPAPPSRPAKSPLRRLRDLLPTSAMLLLIPVLLVFLLPNVRAAPPTLGVSGTALAGTMITVSGGGYLGHAAVDLRWDGDRVVASVRPDSDGEFEVRVLVPASAGLGEHELSAVDPAVESSGDVAAADALASTTVTVVDGLGVATPVSRSAEGSPVPASSGSGAPAPGASSPARSGAPGDPTSGATATPSERNAASAAPPTPKPKPKPKPTATPKPPVPAGEALYVATSGSDGNPGTRAAPFRTVEKGLRTVRPGQTLYLRGGTYVENVEASPRGSSSARILVSAYPGERPVVKGLVSISNPMYVTFNGFNVTWNAGSYDDHMFKITGGAGWVLQNSEIWGARSFADLLIAGSPHGWAVRYNVIHDTFGGESNVNRSHNIYANTNLDASGGVIERNLVYNAMHGTNLKLAGAGGSGGGAANVVVRYNTLVNATQPLLIGDGSRNITVSRNIIGKGAKPGVVRLFQLVGSGNSVTNNVLFGASVACDDYESSVRCGSVMAGNHFPVDPKLGSGFRPAASAATGYGRYAP